MVITTQFSRLRPVIVKRLYSYWYTNAYRQLRLLPAELEARCSFPASLNLMIVDESMNDKTETANPSRPSERVVRAEVRSPLPLPTTPFTNRRGNY